MRGGRPPPSLSWTVNGSAGCDRDDHDYDDDVADGNVYADYDTDDDDDIFDDMKWLCSLWHR